MSIKIKRVSIEECGVIKKFNEEFSDLTLIYGKNEQGKSFLVEFIIQCLFKTGKKSIWGQLRKEGSGSVYLTGLQPNPNALKSFTPSSKVKLDDYFVNQKKLPLSFVKLLIIKEGENKLSKNNKAGIDKETIKDLLSPLRILTPIDENIQQVVKDAKISNGIIEIKDMGEGKEYHETLKKLQEVENAILELSEKCPISDLKDLEYHKKELIQEKELQLKAKKYKAYKLHLDIKELKCKIEKFPDKLINDLKSSLRRYQDKIKEHRAKKQQIEKLYKQIKELDDIEALYQKFLKAKRYYAYQLHSDIKEIEKKICEIPEDILKEIQENVILYKKQLNEKNYKEKTLHELNEKCKNYEWLKIAHDTYSKFLEAPLLLNKKLNIIPFIAFALLITSILLIFLEQRTISSFLIITSGLIYGYYFVKVRNNFKNYKQSQELEHIKRKFKSLFSIELEGINQLSELLNEQEKYYNNYQEVKKEIEKLNSEIEYHKRNIEDMFKKLKIDNVPPNQWPEKIVELRNYKEKLIAKKEEIKAKLNDLNVDERDYLPENPSLEFKKNEFQEIEKKRNELLLLKKEADILKDELSYITNELINIRNDIKNMISSYSLAEYLPEFNVSTIQEENITNNWESFANAVDNSIIEPLEKLKNEILQEIERKKGELSGLGISQIEYIDEDPKAEFDPKKLQLIEKELEKIEREKENIEKINNNLKLKLCHIAETDPSTPLNSLLYKLHIKKNDLKNKLMQIESRIIAGNIIHQTLQELHTQEDEKLLELLNFQTTSNYLYKFTQRYNQITFTEKDENLEKKEKYKGDILIGNDYELFQMDYLSTGAQEQVMLALRIAFAQMLLQQEKAFLILDDAFQHSDYEKRKSIVSSLIELVQDGWQIIYLTMDDHIKSLFQEQKPVLKEKYREINLSPSLLLQNFNLI